MAGTPLTLDDAGPSAARLARLDRLLADPPPLTARQQTVRTRRAARRTGPPRPAATTTSTPRCARRTPPWPPATSTTTSAWRSRRLHAACHELTDVDALLRRFPRAATSSPGRTLRAGAQRQRGAWLDAARIYVDLARDEPTWTPIAGLAGVFDDLDDPTTADALYRRAEDDIDVTQMDSLAWVEIQRARLRRRRGDLDRAELHLVRAEAADDGWTVQEERARWLAAAGRPAEAAQAWTAVLAVTGRPDHAHALGDVLLRLGAGDDAAVRHAEAAEGYQRSTAAGRRRYVHHLAEYCLSVSHDLPAAERWARSDHEARPNRHTAEVLAAVLAARGELAERKVLLDDLSRDRAAALLALKDPDFVGEVNAPQIVPERGGVVRDGLEQLARRPLIVLRGRPGRQLDRRALHVVVRDARQQVRDHVDPRAALVVALDASTTVTRRCR